MKRGNKTLLCAAAVMLLCIALWLTDRQLAGVGEVHPLLKPELLHVPMAGAEPVVADLLWMRLVQFLGSGVDLSVYAARQHAVLQFDTITRLDPGFAMVYHYGILFLSANAPEEALALAERAVNFVPAGELQWQIPFAGAFVAYRFSDREDRYEICLRLLDYAERAEGTPGMVKRFRPLVLKEKGDIALALDTWRVLHENTTEGSGRRIIENHVKRTIEELEEREADIDDKLQYEIDLWLDLLPALGKEPELNGETKEKGERD